MKKLFTFSSLLVLILKACTPATRLYDTPPVYFSSPHQTPKTDSGFRLSAGGSLLYPVNSDLHAEGLFFKKMLFQFSYAGNLGGFSTCDDDRIGRYKFSTNAMEGGLGFFDKTGKGHVKWFLVAGYGSGRSRSIVTEYDGSEDFIYEGKFTKLTVTPGLLFPSGKKNNFSFSWRQSFVQFKEYKLPGFNYKNKRQLLTDLMMQYGLKARRFGVNFYIGLFLNGMASGKREIQMQTDIWRIQRVYTGIGITGQFSRK